MPRTALTCLAAVAALTLPAHAAPRVERVTSAPALYETTNVSASQDGRWVAVSAYAIAPRVVAGVYAPNFSEAPAVGPALAQPKRQVWLVDRVTKTAVLVSKAPDGKPADRDARVGAVSADGRYVAFHSTATNLAKGADPTVDAGYLYDRMTRRVSMVARVVDYEHGVTISPDGSTIVFLSGGILHTRDRRTGATRAVTKEPQYAIAGVRANRSGRFVALAHNGLVNLYDTRTGATRAVRGPVADDARCPQQAYDANVCGYTVTAVAIDQAGARVAYVVSTNGSTRVVVTTVATGASTAVASFTGDAAEVAFAPDGSALYWVGPPTDAASATGAKVLYRYAIGTGVRSVVTTLPSAAGCRTDGCAAARLASVAPFANGVLFTTDAPLAADDTDGLMDAYAVTG